MVTSQANAPMKLSNVSMVLILGPATNAVRKVISLGTVVKRVVTTTLCNMGVGNTADSTALAMVVTEVVMMAKVDFTMHLPAVKNLSNQSGRRLLMSLYQLHASARARKGVPATLISLNRCTILEHLKDLDMTILTEEVVSVVRVEVEAVGAGVAVAVGVVDVGMVEMMQAMEMEETLPTRISHLLRLLMFPLLKLKATGLTLVTARHQRHQQLPGGEDMDQSSSLYEK
jgi:hypothetical protein